MNVYSYIHGGNITLVANHFRTSNLTPTFVGFRNGNLLIRMSSEVLQLFSYSGASRLVRFTAWLYRFTQQENGMKHETGLKIEEGVK